MIEYTWIIARNIQVDLKEMSNHIPSVNFVSAFDSQNEVHAKMTTKS